MTDTGPTTPSGNARLQLGDRTTELPIAHGTDGQAAVDVGRLLAETGMTTLDYGYANTAPTRSAVTFLDGEAGILRYRGYPIEQLAERSSFLEVAWLLIHGELPTPGELERWEDDVRRHTLLHEEFKRFFDGFPKDAHPMAILASAVSALSTFYQASADIHDTEAVELQSIRLLAKLPTIAAYAYKKSIGQAFMYPMNALDYEANFLHMMFAVPSEPYEVDPDAAAALRTLLILHADHEQNCSTSTVRLVGSSHANLFVSVSAGIAALWGPLHGGANQEVLEMLMAIRDAGGDVEGWVERAKDKSSGFRLMGFGHRVYHNHDPRARIIKASADTILARLHRRDDLLDIARRLEEVALSDPYFVERKLYPNVDFYSGLIYRALGFPIEMFTVMFALGRLPGWIAHWREMIADPDTRIGRPRQLYVGKSVRDYVPLADRRTP
ncbi:MAG TPA: citrate synthase [Candidatus Limnocylindrales bacterium]|nr:citrate synthase [Candidatus Limnocylindrales bacterium]